MDRVKRMLMVRFSSIGDMVFTTPVIRCVKQQLGCEIHYLTKKSFAPVVEANPYIDKLITVKKDIPEVIEELKQYEYDWIADLHHNLRTARLKSVLRRPGASFPKLNIEKWLLTNFHWDMLPDLTVVDRCFETVRELGVENDHKGYDFFIAAENEINIETITGAQLTAGSYVAVAIAASVATRTLEEHQCIELINKTQLPAILLGGPSDSEAGDRIAAKTIAINMAGKLNLQQSASVTRQSAVVVSGDTGMLHIACALRKPVVAYWGSSIPKFGVSPYYPQGMTDMYRNFEVDGLRCRPCSKIGYRKCPKGHFKCIRHQDLNGMASAVHYFFELSRSETH